MGTNPTIWDTALQSLSPDVQKIINSTRTKKRDVLQAVLDEAEAKRALSLRRRWKFTRSNGEVVIVRDLLEKIVSWIQRFKETGDTIVQYDPTHAALPWAAVRFLLQMAVSEVQLFAAMADDLENISRMLVRYRVFEGLYLRGSQSEAELKLEDALTRLYAEILSHLAAAVQFYDERSVTRILKSPFRTVADTRAKALVEREKEVDAFASLSDAETLRSLEAAFTRLTTQSSQSLSEERFNQILEWLTVAPYYHHHQFITQSRLPSAGQWLLKHPVFMNWRLSSSSSLLLLHGIPGSGKSTLCSVVIDSLLPVSNTNQAATPAPLAYFYCANPRSEKSRSSADDIMRTILFQLAIDSSHRTKMRDFLCSEYERQTALARAGKMDMAKLRVKDCVRLMLELAEQDPLTIVLDGLDSVEDSERPDLIGAFEELVKKADNVVKVFVSSRTTSRSAAKPTHEFEIQTSSQETRADMEAFIDHLVNKAVASKLLLDGRPSPDTREMLKQALVTGAGEMFLWAKLQLERVCRETVEDDIVAVLKDKLPRGINALYQESLNYMLNSGEVARDIAVRVLSCILYMRDPLTPGALLAALAAGKHSTLVLPQVLAICANFVVLDSNCNVLRVAHQSVQDFLMRHETFDPAIANNMLASMCIDACSRGMNSATSTGKALEIPSENFYVYAAMYWPIHSETAARLGNAVSTNILMEDVKSFIFDEEWETTLSFDAWMGNIRDLVPLLPRDHPMKPALDAISLSNTGYLFCLSTFGLNSILEEVLSKIADVNVDQKNSVGHTPLYLAAARGQKEGVVALSRSGAQVNIECGRYGSPLHAACFAGHLDVVDQLLKLGAESSCGSVFKNAFQASCRGRHENLAMFLVNCESFLKSQADYEEALEDAALVGFAQVVQKLQLSPFSSSTARNSDKTMRRIENSIRGGHLGVLRQFLAQDAAKIDLVPSNAVAIATLHNHRDLVEFLLNKGLDIEAESVFGSPLRVASLLNLRSMVLLLLEKGANIHSCGTFGDALQAAALNGHTSIIRLLIQEGAKVKQGFGFYRSALQAASYHGHIGAVELLLSAPHGGIHEPQVLEDAFHAAAAGGHEEIIVLMLGKGFRYRQPPANAVSMRPGRSHKSTFTPSRYEALLRNESPRRGQRHGLQTSRQSPSRKQASKPKQSMTDMTEIFKVALNDSLDIPQTNNETNQFLRNTRAQRPYLNNDLSAAASAGHMKTVKVLLDYAEILDISNETIDRSLIYAATNGQKDIIGLVLRHVASQRCVGRLIEQSLITAHCHQQTDVMETLLDLASRYCSDKELVRFRTQISTRARSFTSDDPSRKSLVENFMKSCIEGETQRVTSMLLEGPCKLLSETEIDASLQLCALHGHSALVEILLNSVAFQHRTPLSGEEAFVSAAAGGFIQIMRLLGYRWGDLLMPTKPPVERALILACQQGHIDVVSYLVVELAADVNMQSPSGGFGSIFRHNDGIPGVYCSLPESVVEKQQLSTTSPLYAALEAFQKFSPTNQQYATFHIHIGKHIRTASRDQQEDLVMLLLRHGADITFQGEQRLSSLQVAAKYCSERVLGQFILLGANMNALQDPKHREELPLCIVAQRELSTMSLVRQFVEAGSIIPEDIRDQTLLLRQTLKFFEGDISVLASCHDCYLDCYHLGGLFLTAPSLEYIFREGPAAAMFFLLSHMPRFQTTDNIWNLVLQMAAVLGDHEYVDLLLDRGTDVNGTGYYYGTALQAAARFGHVKLVQRLLDAGAQANMAQGVWQTPLRAAIVGGSESTVRTLLDNGADLELGFPHPQVNSRHSALGASEVEYMSSLQLAVQSKVPGIVQMLLGKGADPNCEIVISQCPLILAARHGDLNIVESLIDSGALVNVKGTNQGVRANMSFEDASPLHAASAGGSFQVVRRLLPYAASSDGCVDTSLPLLRVAAQHGQSTIVRHLLSTGFLDEDGEAAEAAISNNHVEVMRELLAGGANPATMLITACRLGQLGIVDLLLENIPDKADCQDVINQAFSVADGKCLQLLLSYVSPTAKQFLHVCAVGSMSAVKGILDEGKIDVNQPVEEDGDFPLQIAALHLRPEIVELLVSRGAKIESKSVRLESPLITSLEACAALILDARLENKLREAIKELGIWKTSTCASRNMIAYETSVSAPARLLDCEKILKILVSHGARVARFERPLGSPLHIACAIGSKDMVLFLVEHGASFEETSGHFERVAFAAIYGQNTDVILLLLSDSQVLKHVHREYGTVLHYSCMMHDGISVRLLLKHGADATVEDVKGRTPLTIALDNERSPLIRASNISRNQGGSPLEIIREYSKEMKKRRRCCIT